MDSKDLTILGDGRVLGDEIIHLLDVYFDFIHDDSVCSCVSERVVVVREVSFVAAQTIVNRGMTQLACWQQRFLFECDGTTSSTNENWEKHKISLSSVGEGLIHSTQIHHRRIIHHFSSIRHGNS